MPAPVYSTRFTVQQGLNGIGTTITVPAGYVYVVKQLTVYADPTLGTARAFFRDLVSGATLFSAAVPIGTPGWFGFYGTLVFETGQTFRWETSTILTDAMDVGAWGFALTTP
jgi:hypothetical protein